MINPTEEIERLAPLATAAPEEQADRIRVVEAEDHHGNVHLVPLYTCPGCTGAVPLEVLADRDAGLCHYCERQLRLARRHENEQRRAAASGGK